MKTVATAVAPFTTARVALPSGVRLNYVRGGPRDRVAVIMLHGLSDSSFSFSRVMPLLANQFDVIALDQRGHGDSDRPERGYAVDDFAQDVLDVMDSLHIGRAIIVGHCMGSFIARRVAERAPSRVIEPVVVATALNARNSAIAELITALDSMSDPLDEAFIREFQMSCVARAVPDAFMTQVVAESRKVPLRVWKAALAGLWSYRPRWPLTIPTVIVGGEKDAVFSHADHRAVYRAIERSALHLEPEVGHTFHWEMPERFVQVAFHIE